MYLCDKDYERANVEYACGILNHDVDDTSSRKHGTRTVSRSCEYACAFSNLENDENVSRTHHTRTASRSCEYACGLAKYQLD